jgi:hypothetical protein
MRHCLYRGCDGLDDKGTGVRVSDSAVMDRILEKGRSMVGTNSLSNFFHILEGIAYKCAKIIFVCRKVPTQNRDFVHALLRDRKTEGLEMTCGEARLK